MEFWDCARVQWGPFERPLRMLFEHHGNFDPRSKCRDYTGNNAVFLSMLASLWVNDTEVADWLQATYGLPIYSGPIKWTQETTGPIITHTLTWGLEGKPQSIITFPLDTADRETFPEPDFRYFWFNSTHLSYLEATVSYDNTAKVGREGYGKVYPPMLASKYSNEFAGFANWFLNGQMSGTIHRFSDFECQEPLE